MNPDRLLVLDELAAKIGDISLGRPTRIAIDGRTAAGKTTLSDELAALVGKRGRPVIRTSIAGQSLSATHGAGIPRMAITTTRAISLPS
jgi:uridine kinase